MLNRFDMNLLAALDALLHEKNVTRAAQRVHVSQRLRGDPGGTIVAAHSFTRPPTGETT